MHKVAAAESTYALARPPEDISAESLVEFGQGMLHDRNGRRRSPAVEAIRRSQRELAARTSLAALTARAAG